MEHTGFSKAPITAALQWLEDTGAIYNVPVDKRVGKEAEIHHKRKVWQLTGVIKLNTLIPYLFLKTEDLISVLDELKTFGKPADGVVDLLQTHIEFNAKPDDDDRSSGERKKAKGSSNELKEGSSGKRSPDEPESISSKDSEGIQVSNDSSAEDADAGKPADEPVDPEKQRNRDIASIIRIYLDTGVIEKKPGAEYAKKPNRDMAMALLNAGITVDQVQRYVQHLKGEKFWKARSISLNHILNNIKPWIEIGEPGPEAETDNPIPEAHKPWEPPEDELYVNPEAANRISAALTRIVSMGMNNG